MWFCLHTVFDCRIKHTTQDNNVGFGVRVDIPYLLTVVGTCERTDRFLHPKKNICRFIDSRH